MIVMVIGLLYATLHSQSSPTFVSDCNRKMTFVANTSRRNVIFPSEMGHFPSETAYFPLVNAKQSLQFLSHSTDRLRMNSRETAREPTFRYILEEKLRDKTDTVVLHESVSTVRPAPTAGIHIGPVGTADRLFGLRYFQRPDRNRGYSVAKQPSAAAKSRKPKPRQIKVEQLSREAQLALITLGISPERDTGSMISPADVRRAFHRLAKKFHPDIATMDAWQAQRESYLLAQEAYDLICRDINILMRQAA